MAIPGVAASGFLRVVTHPRVFREPTPTSVAVEFLNALLASPTVSLTNPSPRHWRILAELATDMELRGNSIPDAYLATIAIESGATFVTADQGFTRFTGLRLEAL